MNRQGHTNKLPRHWTMQEVADYYQLRYPGKDDLLARMIQQAFREVQPNDVYLRIAALLRPMISRRLRWNGEIGARRYELMQQCEQATVNQEYVKQAELPLDEKVIHLPRR